MFHEKKHVYFSESLLAQLKNGIEKIKSRLLGHHQIKQDMIYQVIQKLQIKIELLVVRKKYVIVEFPVKNKWTSTLYVTFRKTINIFNKKNLTY